MSRRVNRTRTLACARLLKDAMLIAKMSKPAKPPVRAKRAKTEVQEEFAEIRQEAQTARESADPKAQEAARLRAAEIRQNVEGTTVEGVVQGITSLGLEISRALSDLSGNLVEEVERLSAVREAVELERAELERLHKIDVAATALDQLVQDHAREKDRLETEVATQRTAWEEESRSTERERKDQEDNLKKSRAREIEEYEYKKTLERKKAQDKYDEDQRLQEKKNKERQEALEKSWQQRETALKEQEQELMRLRKEVEEFPETVRTESEKAAVLAAKAAGQKFEQEILLLKKEAETEKRLSSLQVKTLEDALARQAAQISGLEKQVDEAKQQVQDIAVKAIEGASGAKALAHINQIAMEQAKRPQQ
jgi:colicin import membrane protein